MRFQLSQRGRKLTGAAIIGAAVGLVAAAFAAVRPGVLERGEVWTYDMRARAAADPARASRDIVLVNIGESDLQRVEAYTGLTWPWPRVFYGYIADYAIEGGAKAVILDFIFQDRGAWGADVSTTGDGLNFLNSCERKLRKLRPSPCPGAASV